MNRIAPIVVLAGAFALGGCDPKQESPVTFAHQDTISDARLYTTQICPSRAVPRAAGNQHRVGAMALGLVDSIASAVIPALVEVPLDLLAGAIREASKDRRETYAAQVATHLHRPSNAKPNETDNPDSPNENDTTRAIPNVDLGCLVFIRGQFGRYVNETSISPDFKTFGKKSTETDSGVFNFLMNQRIALSARELKTYLEIGLEISPDFSAFRLVPHFAYVDRKLRDSEVVVSVSIYLPRGGRDLTPVAIAATSLDGIEDRKTLDFSGFPALGSAWIPYPGLDGGATQAIARIESARARIQQDKTQDKEALVRHCIAEVLNRSATPRPLVGPVPDTKCLELRESVLRAAAAGWASEANGAEAAIAAAELARTQWIRSTLSGAAAKTNEDFLALRKLHRYLSPATIEFEVIESRKGSPFLKAVADILDKSKKGVGDALVASLSPAERAKRQADEEQRTRNSRAAVAAAQDLVKLRQAELDDLPATATRAARVKAENDLRQAKIAANNAYIADGRVPPYPEAQP